MDQPGRITFLGAPLPRAAVLRVVTIPPGGWLGYDEDVWRDALVVVEDGEIEIECRAGGRRGFSRGAVLWLAGLPVLGLRNPGDESAVLAAVARRPGHR